MKIHARQYVTYISTLPGGDMNEDGARGGRPPLGIVTETEKTKAIN